MNDGQIKIVLIGDSGVGKTTMIQSYLSQMPEKFTNPTVGSMFFSKTLNIEGKVYSLQVASALPDLGHSRPRKVQEHDADVL